MGKVQRKHKGNVELAFSLLLRQVPPVRPQLSRPARPGQQTKLHQNSCPDKPRLKTSSEASEKATKVLSFKGGARLPATFPLSATQDGKANPKSLSLVLKHEAILLLLPNWSLTLQLRDNPVENKNKTKIFNLKPAMIFYFYPKHTTELQRADATLQQKKTQSYRLITNSSWLKLHTSSCRLSQLTANIEQYCHLTVCTACCPVRCHIFEAFRHNLKYQH